MSRCFCVHYDDEVDLFVDLDSAEYTLIPDDDHNYITDKQNR